MCRAEGEDGDGLDVLVFASLGAEPRRGRLRERSRRRPRRAEAGHVAPEPVPISRVTVIASEAFADERAAREWLERCRDERVSAAELDYAMQRVNRAVHAHRLAAADPYVGDVSAAQARRVRLGYGAGEELVEGGWREAWTVPAAPQKRARRAMLAPQEQVARILSGRRPAQPSEDLLLRARLDLREGRARQSALQARAAYAALAAELRAEPGTEQVLSTLEEGSAPLDRIATAALEGSLDSSQVGELDDAIAELERIARKRRHAHDADA
jgi:hypothetical protein